MSLYVYLSRKKWVSFDEGKTHTEEIEEVYSANITHNLNRMAGEAGIYEALWHPEYKGYKYAKDIIEPIEKGLKDMKERPEFYNQFNAPNGWGMYEHFIPWIERYLDACKDNPNAVIKVST